MQEGDNVGAMDSTRAWQEEHWLLVLIDCFIFSEARAISIDRGDRETRLSYFYLLGVMSQLFQVLSLASYRPPRKNGRRFSQGSP